MNEQKLLIALQAQLMPDEKVEAHVRGNYLVGIFTNTGPRKGLLVATSHRMLFYGESLLNGQSFDTHPYAAIQTFEVLKQIGTAHFKWATAERRYDLRYASGDITHFAQVVHPRVGQVPPIPDPSGIAQAAVPAATTLGQQIANLAALHEQGVLTAEQYSAAVTRLRTQTPGRHRDPRPRPSGESSEPRGAHAAGAARARSQT